MKETINNKKKKSTDIIDNYQCKVVEAENSCSKSQPKWPKPLISQVRIIFKH